MSSLILFFFPLTLKRIVTKIFDTDGDFNKDAISEFVLANKLPLITPFTRETAHKIFDSVIKKHVSVVEFIQFAIKLLHYCYDIESFYNILYC